MLEAMILSSAGRFDKCRAGTLQARRCPRSSRICAPCKPVVGALYLNGIRTVGIHLLPEKDEGVRLPRNGHPERGVGTVLPEAGAEHDYLIA